jgi:hypothetical protein
MPVSRDGTNHMPPDEPEPTRKKNSHVEL